MCRISEKVKPRWPIPQILTFVGRFLPTMPIVPAVDLLDKSVKVPEKKVIEVQSPIRYNRRPRLGTVIELLRVTEYLSQRLGEVDIPFIVLHGSDDMVTHPNVSRALYEEAASGDKTLKMFLEMLHSLLFGETDENVELGAIAFMNCELKQLHPTIVVEHDIRARGGSKLSNTSSKCFNLVYPFLICCVNSRITLLVPLSMGIRPRPRPLLHVLRLLMVAVAYFQDMSTDTAKDNASVVDSSVVGYVDDAEDSSCRPDEHGQHPAAEQGLQRENSVRKAKKNYKILYYQELESSEYPTVSTKRNLGYSSDERTNLRRSLPCDGRAASNSVYRLWAGKGIMGDEH